jgi:hypothetical protein
MNPCKKHDTEYAVKLGSGFECHLCKIEKLENKRKDNAKKIAELEAELDNKTPLLARHQPCGCIICTCMTDDRCLGCGAKNCGTHPPGEIPNPLYQNKEHITELEKGLSRKIRIMLSNSDLQLSMGYLAPILNNQLKRTDIAERVEKVLKIMEQALEEQEDRG